MFAMNACMYNLVYAMLMKRTFWYIYIRCVIIDTHSCHAIVILVYIQLRKRPASAPGASRLNQAPHDMRVTIVILNPVFYVRHTVMSRTINFGVYQASERAASAP